MTDRPTYPDDDDDDFSGVITPPRRAADKDLDPVGPSAPAPSAASPERAPEARPAETQPQVTYAPAPAPATYAAPSPQATAETRPAAYQTSEVVPVRSRRGPRPRVEVTQQLNTRLEIGIRNHLVAIADRNNMSIRDVLETLVETYGDLVRPPV